MAYCYRHPDRETGLSCSVCERPICTDCATFAPVGIRCPDHAGGPKHAQVRQVRRQLGRRGRTWNAGEGLVTRILIGINVAIFVINLAQGASLGENGGTLFVDWALIGQALGPDGTLIGVAEGEWWRMLTAAFLHGSILHLGLNMLMLWWVGAPMEAALGRGRFIVLYLISALAGSAGALLLTEAGRPTVGASGAIFGVLGAALVLEQQRNYVLGGSALSIIVLNLIITFYSASSGGQISVGGHLGGLIGGAGVSFALSGFGRGTATYRRIGAMEVAGVVAVAVVSLALAYWRVEGYPA
jgi:membrane associated rhomboid family serine protease